MIGLLRGNIVECQPTRIIFDVHGVGYEIFIPLSTYDAINAAPNPVTLYTYLHVREDALQLFGFATQGEKALFLKVIAVSGIGPRVALGILSSANVDDFARFIRAGDVVRLKGLPGVGKKTAERLILELKDKFEGAQVDSVSGVASLEGQIMDEAVMALVSLGYSRTNVEKKLRKIAENCTVESVEALIKEALRRL